MYYARIDEEHSTIKKCPVGGIPPKKSLGEALTDPEWLQLLITFGIGHEVKVRHCSIVFAYIFSFISIYINTITSYIKLFIIIIIIVIILWMSFTYHVMAAAISIVAFFICL